MDTKDSKKTALRQFLAALRSGELLAVASGKPGAPAAGGPNRPLAFTGDGKPGGNGSGESASPPPPKKPPDQPSEPPKKPDVGKVTGAENSQPPMSPEYMRQQEQRQRQNAQRQQRQVPIEPPPMSQSQIAAENARAAGYTPQWGPPSPGDGVEVPLKQVFEEMGKGTGMVSISGSHDWHRRMWQEGLGKKGNPPTAFKFGDRIRVDIERLTPQDRETFVKLDRARDAALERNTYPPERAGGGGGGDGGGGGPPQEPVDPLAPTDPASKPPDAEQAIEAEAEDIARSVEDYKQSNADSAKKPAANLSPGDKAKLHEEGKARLTEREAIRKRFDAMADKLAERGVQGSSPKDIYENAQRLPAGSGLARAGMALFNAYLAFQAIKHVWEAEDQIHAAFQEAASFAVGTVEFGITAEAMAKHATKNPIAANIAAFVAVMFFSNLKDGRGTTYNTEGDLQEQRKAVRQKREMFLASILHEAAPGSVDVRGGNDGRIYTSGNEVVVLDQQLWDETAKALVGVGMAKLHQLGFKDGLAGEASHFVEVQSTVYADEDEDRLALQNYDVGYKEGGAKRLSILARARALADNDANAGKGALGQTEFVKWPEYQSIGPAIQAAYHQAYAAGQKTHAKAQQEVVLERARELGTKDGNAWKGKVHWAEIIKWPEFSSMSAELTLAYVGSYDQASTTRLQDNKEHVFFLARQAGEVDGTAGNAAAHLSELKELPEYKSLGPELENAYFKAYNKAAAAAKEAELHRAHEEYAYINDNTKAAAANREAVLQRARDLGQKDGKAGKGLLHQAEISNWPEYQSMGPAIQSAYSTAYVEAKNEAAMQRARELGVNDRKAGKGALHEAEIAQWPEYQTLGVALYTAYSAGFGGGT